MADSNLNRAKKAKNDEFYTQYYDIEEEVCDGFIYNETEGKGLFRLSGRLCFCD